MLEIEVKTAKVDPAEQRLINQRPVTERGHIELILPRAVARLPIGVNGPPVGHAREGAESEGEDVLARAALKVGYETDTTGIVLEGRIIQSSNLAVCVRCHTKNYQDSR